MQDNEEVLIALGHEAKLFLSSNLGKHIQDRSELEIEIAYQGLESIDPEDTKGIRRLQNIIMVYRNFNQWLVDAAMAGEIAYSEYLEEGE